MAELSDSAVSTSNDVDFIDVEVVYAEPQGHHLIQLRLPIGSTLRQAMEVSGLAQRIPEIDLTKSKLGINGKIARPGTPLSAGDRIEIYRPLIADPKEIRRQRVAAGVQSRMGLKRSANSPRDDDFAT